MTPETIKPLAQVETLIDAPDYTIVKKSYQLDFSRVEEGFLFAERICFTKNINEARKILLKELQYEDVKIKKRWEVEELSYLNIPVVRNKEGDLIVFEGKEIIRHEVSRLMFKRERYAALDAILNNENYSYCYIRKHGSYYNPSSAGYTQFPTEAGVFVKLEAVQEAKSCDEITIIPIDRDEHNAAINKKIKSLQSRLI